MNKENITWKDAVLSSPGPRSVKDILILMLKGFCMGTADIIPGVSGGTIAFITGIYIQLLRAIESINLTFFHRLLTFKFKEAIALVHVRFLFPLLFGIGLAIVGTARLMHFFITVHPVPTWSLFFGLIAASILIVGKAIEKWDSFSFVAIVIGSAFSFYIVGLIPVTTPETWWFIFFSGMIAICAMILPGLSGAFLLLVLGKYEYITGAIKNPLVLENLLVLLIFIGGCIIGIFGFSRILNYFLGQYRNMTMCILTGIMIGAMRKIWPWKEIIQTKIIRGKEYILQTENIIPENFDSQFFLAVFLAFIGLLFVALLDKFSNPKNKEL